MKFLVNREQFKTKKKLDGNNYLVAYDVPIAKTGIQYYTLAEIGVANSSQQVPVYRDTKTFKDDRLVESFDGMPLVFCHPDNGEVSSDNFRDYVVGTVSGPYEKNGYLYAKKITIIDDQAIDSILSKKNNELSIGFRAQVERKPGKFNGTKFEYVEKVIHGNHLALCTKGKAGPFFAINSTKIGGKMGEFAERVESDIQSGKGLGYFEDESLEEEKKEEKEEVEEKEEKEEEFLENELEQDMMIDKDDARFVNIKALIESAVEKKIRQIRPAEMYSSDKWEKAEEKEMLAIEKEEMSFAERAKDKALLNSYKKRTEALKNEINTLTKENLDLKTRIDLYTEKMRDLSEKIKARKVMNAFTGPEISSDDFSKFFR
jgi:hypothetical protein